MGDVRRIDRDGDEPVAATLDDLAREGARGMIAAALEAEVDEYVGAFLEESTRTAGGSWSATGGAASAG